MSWRINYFNYFILKNNESHTDDVQGIRAAALFLLFRQYQHIQKFLYNRIFIDIVPWT